MRGYAMLGVGKTGWVEKDRPSCGSMDAILRPIAVAPCTTDVHTVWEGVAGEKEDIVILGHEGVGEIIEVGSLVKDFKRGDLVIVPSITPKWNAVESQIGNSEHCGGLLGGWELANINDGVFGEFFKISDADGNLAHLPKGVKPEEGAMVSDMVATGFTAGDLANIQFGDTVCVIGIGPVGLMALASSVMRGASYVYAIGSRPNCVDVAKAYGASDVINYKNGDIVKQVIERNGGEFVDKVIIAGGDANTYSQAISMVKPGGTVANVAFLSEGIINIPLAEYGGGLANKTIVGGCMIGGRARIERLARLLSSGRLDTSLLLTHRLDGFENVKDALFLMKDKPQDLIKPVVSIKW